MALLPSKKEIEKKKIQSKDIQIEDDVNITYGKKIYKAKERLPVQLDPPVKETIESIAYAKDIPMYKVVELAVDSYLDKLTESERNIYDMRQKKYS